MAQSHISQHTDLVPLQGLVVSDAIPHFVIDAPGGGGKIPLIPNYVLHKDDEKIVLRNFKHKIYTYRNYHDKNNPELPIDLNIVAKANKEKAKNIKTGKVKLPRVEKVKS